MTVLDNIKVAVALLKMEPDGSIGLLLANKAYHDLTGYKTDTIGQNIFEFVDATQHNFLRKQFANMIEYHQPVEYIIWAKVPLGRRAFEVEMIPVLTTGKDRVKEVIVMFSDITTMVKLQEEVRTLRAAQYSEEQSKTRD